MSSDTEQTPSSQEEDALRKRARLGMILLGARAAAQHGIIVVANVYLARTLTPADYGIYAIVQYALALFRLLGDAGLGAALIQQKEEPDRRDLSGIWWLQLTLSSAFVIAIFFLAPWLLRDQPELPPVAVWLVRGLSLGFLFTMLRAIPMVLMERNLKYGWLATLESAGTFIHYGTAVALAALGYGAAALVTGLVFQTATMALLANLVMPFRPSFKVDLGRLGSLLRFGVQFQATHVVGFINQSVTPIVVGVRQGQAALGLVNFARDMAWLPTLPLGIIARVSFPFLSRLQHNRQAFGEELERAIVLCGVPTFYFVGLCMGTAPALVEIIYSNKWEAAVPSIYVFSAAISTGYLYTIGSSALDALGRPGLVFRMTLIVTLVNWPAVFIATSFGDTPETFAIGYATHVFVGSVLMLWTLRTTVPESNPVPRLVPLVVGGVVVAIAGRQVLPYITGPLTLIGWVLASVLLFFIVALGVDPRLRAALRLLIERMRARSRS